MEKLVNTFNTGLLISNNTAAFESNEDRDELFKYQQIISRAASKFQGTAFLAYDEHFCCQAAHDLRITWDQVDIELRTVTFSDLAKPHCLVCASPHYSQTSCPNTDPLCQSSKNGPVCFRFNRSSGCNSRPCPFPHVC